MPFPVDPQIVSQDICQFIVRTAWRSQLAENVYWFKMAGSAETANVYDVLNAFQDIAKDVYIPAINNQAFYLNTQLYIRTTTEWSGVYQTPPDLSSGTGGETPLPTQVTGIISRYAKGRGAQYRGRVYIPFPSTDYLGDDEEPTAGYSLILNGIRDQLLNPVDPFIAASKTFTPGICNGPPLPPNWKDLMASTAQARWATQRRRGDYGPPNIT